MITPAITHALAIRGGANEVSGTLRCDPWAEERRKPRWWPVVAGTAVLALFLGFPWNALAVIASVLLTATFLVFYAATPHTEVLPWRLRGSRLTLAGRHIPLWGVDSFTIHAGDGATVWTLELKDGEAVVERIWIDSAHTQAEVEWLASTILRFGGLRGEVPKALHRLQAVK